MTAAYQPAALASSPSVAVPRFARLYRTELHRLAARRFARVLLVVGVLGYVVAFVIIGVEHKRVDAADRAQATVQRNQQLAQQRQFYQQCRAQAPVGQADQQCPPPPSAAEFPIDNFFHNNPLQPGQLRDLALAVGGGVALLGFALGATLIGAEWSSKNLVAWLFWEPRRMRLLGAKLFALLTVTLILSVLAQLAYAVIGRLLLHYRGVPVSSLQPPDPHFWTGLAWVQFRAALLVIPTAVLGFGLANLIRNTAAAFAVSFVYFAVLESVARALSHHLAQYLFTTSLAAWVSKAGILVDLGSKYDPKQNTYIEQYQHVSNLHGGVTLLVYAGVVLAASGWLFHRRDIA